jgi:ammonia channel protein AmtB
LLDWTRKWLMTPGLAFFYGGLVGRKNVLAGRRTVTAISEFS